MTAETLRLIQSAGGPAVIPADHRFVGFRVLAHIRRDDVRGRCG